VCTHNDKQKLDKPQAIQHLTRGNWRLRESGVYNDKQQLVKPEANPELTKRQLEAEGVRSVLR
jgi:hypothetical protein